jgi:hypothetical protein
MDLGGAIGSSAAVWIAILFLAIFMGVTLLLAARQDH